MITLFPDQESSIEKLRAEMRKHKRVLLQGETGSGKSVMASYMISSALRKGYDAAFLVPRKELLRQMSETFDQFNINHSFVASGKMYNPYSRAYIATVGSLANRLQMIKPKILFCDETHHGDKQLGNIIEHYAARGAWIVGLTATPENPNLHKWYETMVLGPTIPDLIKLKRLSDFRYFAPSRPDLSGIKTVAGEYAKGQLDSFMQEQGVLIGDAVKHYRQHAMGRLNMTFCTSIKHSQMVSQAFRDQGIPSVHIDGDTPENERRRIARAFARREILNLTSVDLLLFGYDLASASGIRGANVESMSDLRPTKSRRVQRQKIGRVLRYKDYPALIFDHAVNHGQHGLPDETVEWSLEPPEDKKKTGAPGPATAQCQNCFHIFRPAPTCPECGHARVVKSREIEEIDGELQEIVRQQEIKERKTEQGRADSLDELIEIGKKRNMRYPAQWAAKVLAARMAKKQNKGEKP